MNIVTDIAIFIVCIALAGVWGFCDAVIDVLSFRWEKSIFSHKRLGWWYPHESYKNKHSKSIWKANLPKSLRWLPFHDATSDAWHVYKTAGIFAILAALAVASFISTWYLGLGLFVVGGLVRNIINSSFFNNKLIKKS